MVMLELEKDVATGHGKVFLVVFTEPKISSTSLKELRDRLNVFAEPQTCLSESLKSILVVGPQAELLSLSVHTHFPGGPFETL